MIKECFFLFLLFVASSNPVDEWDVFEKRVRDQVIEKDSARALFPEIYERLKKYSSQYQFADTSKWIFPVEGYSVKDAGEGGFRPNIRYGSSPVKGYCFYDGNKHGGHPAYDIFIHDRDRNCMDDNTQRPVNIVSPVTLLIISTYANWQEDSEIRGGNYVWAMDPQGGIMFYFAHLNTVNVSKGDFCKAGDIIGSVGRSGKNAYQQKSPTHLHLMLLKVDNDSLIPFDFWEYLKSE